MERTPLSLLRQKPPEAYLLGSGDVLGIWIEGVLGERGQAPPVRVADSGRQGAALGFPIPVRADGTIALPLVPPIKVAGRTLDEVDANIRKAYTVDKKIIQPGQERIIVTLQRAREYHILVIRQDSATGAEAGGGAAAGSRTTGFTINLGGGIRGSRRGTGYAIDLPANENDVLNALARTGGFPGSDAVDEVIVERGAFTGEQSPEELMKAIGSCPPGSGSQSAAAPGTRRIRIPLRYRPGNPPQIRPEDVILQNGDIVFIEAREADVFYAAGSAARRRVRLAARLRPRRRASNPAYRRVD